MLDKLKLFNSRSSSRASSIASLEDPEVSNADLSKANVCPVHSEAHLGNQQPITANISSPKQALKGISQRTLGRTLVPKVKAAEKDKEKVKPKCKDKTKKQSSVIEQDQIMEKQEEIRPEPAPLAESKKSSLIPKGTKSHSSAKKEGSSQSGIPKPGPSSKTSGWVKNSVIPLGGKMEHSRGFRSGSASLALKCPMENKNLISTSSLVSTEGRCSQSSSSNITQISNANNIQLPQTQHSHPNTATVAPFMYRSDVTEYLHQRLHILHIAYNILKMNKCCLLFVHHRSQTDVDKSSGLDRVEEKEKSVLQSKSIHTSLESLRG